MAVTFTSDISILARRGVSIPVNQLRVRLLNSSNVELSTANGYVQGGKLLENVRYVFNAGVLTVYADNVGWKATGAAISAAKARIGAIMSEPIVSIDFGTTLTAPVNTSLILRWHTDGLFQYSLL